MSEPTRDDELRAVILAEMFIGLGGEAPKERIAYYLRLLGNIPPPLLRTACDSVVMGRDEGYPPSPGAIARRAAKLHGEARARARDLRARARWDSEVQAVLAERAQGDRCTGNAESGDAP